MDYNIIKYIGKGSFSNVYLCKSNKICNSSFLFNVFDDSIDEHTKFIIKEININNLVMKYVKNSKPRKIIKKVSEIKSVSITPYDNKFDNKLIKKLEELNSEETYYYKRLHELIESEIEVLHKLSHDNIIKFFSSDINKDVYRIKMEYCECGDLYDILKKRKNNGDFTLRNSHGGFDNKFIMKYLMDTISGLRYLHSMNIIHRDIKLHNVLVKKHLENEFIFKLSDFGFACIDLECDLNTDLTSVDFDFVKNALKKKYYKLCGTPYYMAPEIILNINEFEELISTSSKQSHVKFYDKKIDIWSYGICLYELIFNKLPFSDIYDINDLKIFFSKPSAQLDMHKMIDSEKMISNRLKYLLKSFLTINPSFRISAHDAYDYIKSDFGKNKFISDKEMLNNIVSEYINNEKRDEILDISRLNKSWVIENNQSNSWDKINKASSLLMKVSVDNNFMKWLLKKK